MNSKDLEDSKKSIQTILLLAPIEEREIYEKMLLNIFNNPKTNVNKKIVKISTIIRLLATKENFHRLMKESKQDFVKVFGLVSLSIGPSEFKMLLKSAYFKLKKKAGR